MFQDLQNEKNGQLTQLKNENQIEEDRLVSLSQDLNFKLQKELKIRDLMIVAARAERVERNTNAEIRQEQDAAFQATLLLDQNREQQKLEAAEAKHCEEEAEKARIQTDIDRKDYIARQKIELASEIPNEPPANEPQAVQIVIKLPEGQRLERRFLKSQSLKVDIYLIINEY